MNIALEQTEEHANGKVINRYGDAFIRGNNGTLTPSSLKPNFMPSVILQSFTSQQLKPYKGSTLPSNFFI